MSSPCLSGGGRAYGFDIEIVKSPSTSTRTSHTSSPSSTLSESSNSPLAISTRKPRTHRKRPNQNYNEAAALLSTAYPNIFSTTNPRKFTKPHQDTLLLDESLSSSELLWPFRVFDEDSGFLLHQSEKPSFLTEPKVLNLMNSCDKYSCQSDSQGNSLEFPCDGYEEDFDAESILDEEIEEGIDSIMGNLSVSNNKKDDQMSSSSIKDGVNSWYGNPMGFHFLGNGMRKGVRALRHGNEANLWNFPIVDMLQISPRLSSSSSSNNNNKKKSTSDFNSKLKSKKKKNKVEKSSAATDAAAVELKNMVELGKEKHNSIPQQINNSGLLLKLNYDSVLNAWSDKGSPFSEEIEGGNDVSARLAQIDLFSDNGGLREASVMRYKEKRRTRLFSKKIRYQVRKVNADQRPRMKGRFVRRPNSSTSSQRREK